IVDPRTDRVVNKGRETALADARSLDPQALADWLAGWVG
ncbi:MAG: thiol reductase thioredoxin, partial [Sphingomonas sp.]